jgi:hypothetical protein
MRESAISLSVTPDRQQSQRTTPPSTFFHPVPLQTVQSIANGQNSRKAARDARRG